MFKEGCRARVNLKLRKSFGERYIHLRRIRCKAHALWIFRCSWMQN